MRRTLLAVPALGVVGALLLAPLCVLLAYSFWQVNFIEIVPIWTLDNYRFAFDEYGALIMRTVGVGALAAAVTTLLAIPLAYAVRYKLGRAQHAVMFLLLLALFSGYIVRIYAWKTILGEHGIVNAALQGLGLIEQPLSFILFSRVALIITLTNFLLPIAVLPIYGALQNLPRERIDASHDLGAGRLETVWRVVLPEIALAVFVSFALCLVLAAGDWVTPTLVGGPSSLMVGQVITGQFGNAFNWPFGGALAFSTAAILLIAVLVTGCAAIVFSRARQGRAT
jgi:spermidine/putrescine transport system permease protein